MDSYHHTFAFALSSSEEFPDHRRDNKRRRREPQQTDNANGRQTRRRAHRKLYSLIGNRETIQEYEHYLPPRLKLGKRMMRTESKETNIQRKMEELVEQNARLLDLLNSGLA
jgi:hypothetical protein